MGREDVEVLEVDQSAAIEIPPQHAGVYRCGAPEDQTRAERLRRIVDGQIDLELQVQRPPKPGGNGSKIERPIFKIAIRGRKRGERLVDHRYARGARPRNAEVQDVETVAGRLRTKQANDQVLLRREFAQVHRYGVSGRVRFTRRADARI